MKWTEPPLWEKILVQETDIPIVKPEELPETAIFEGWGWVAMRSDWSADAVFAHLTCGLTGQAEPADLDDTSFIIYHKGLLAIDGIKPYANPNRNTAPYARQTLGHNTITLLDPDEVLRGNHCYQYTWRPNPFPVNDGGQSWKGLGESNRAKTSAGLDFPQVRGPSHQARLGWIRGYQTTPLYDYTSMDGTNCYNENKMKQFNRQFVFLKPNCFVVFDRVVSTKPEFRKRWHLHFQNEPTIEGKVAYAENEGGRLYCETLLPEQASMKKVQGAKLEQADGTYAIPEDWKKSPTKTWRLDVGPSKANAEDLFLHVLQAVDAGKPKTYTARKVERNGMTGVEVTNGNRTFEVLFATEGEAAGHIKVTENGKVVADRDFPQKIDDTYALWKDDPRFKMWMTDPRFRYTILPEDRRRFGNN
jgi:heparin/heparan-sulfate lyase